MGTTDNIFLHGLINHMINNGKKMFCCFVDFSKAFDYIERYTLWTKLIKFGIRGKILTVIKSMYDDIRTRVKFDNMLSNDLLGRSSR